jgi:basic membrane lipoprotein Med (substrate-binding protein (PBP1-ABC) superfamily)
MFHHARWLRRMLLIMAVLLIAALGLSACDDDEDDKKEDEKGAVNADWRLGLVTNVGGTISDGGFSESAHLGAQRAVSAFNLDYAYAQSRDENDYAIQLDKQIAEGRNIIITVGFPMEAITYEYAQNNPNVYFIGVDQSYGGQEIPANLIGLQFADDEAAFIVGALAGMMTQSNTVAVIGGMEIPPVVRLAEGFQNGAKYVNPDVEVLITYTGVFDNPDLGTETAQDFIGAGADVIFGAAGLTGYAGINYAAREGAWVIGVDQDEWRTNFGSGAQAGSDHILTSALKRVDNGVYQAIASIVNGDPQSGIFLLDTAGCGVGYAPFHQAETSIPAEARTMMEAIWRALAAGTLETGASDTSTTPPEALGPGELPNVPEDAPQLSDCQS